MANHGITILIWFRNFFKQIEGGNDTDMELIDIVENLEFNLWKLPIFQISTIHQGNSLQANAWGYKNSHSPKTNGIGVHAKPLC